MAELMNPNLQGLRGAMGKQLVFKQYAGKTVVTRYPNMEGIVPSEAQKEKRNLFREAVAYAAAINRNPQQKAAYREKIPEGTSVYHHALKEYLARHKK